MSQKKGRAVGNREVNRLQSEKPFFFFFTLTAEKSFDPIISLFVELTLLSELLLPDKPVSTD